MLKPVTVSAPAKLVLTGEYAVLEPDELAVVAAVDRFTEARVEKADQMLLTAPALDLTQAPAGYAAGRWGLAPPHPKASFVTEALSVTLSYLEEGGTAIAPFHLAISPALAEAGVKIGLGGSAATTVAVVGAVLQAFGDPADPGIVYRLAAIAHLRAQGSGSGIDVAASAFGGVLAFSSHHPAWLAQRVAQTPSIRAVVGAPWPHLRIEPLPWPAGWLLLAGWTGTSASTPEFLSMVERLKAGGSPGYPAFLEAMRDSSRTLIAGLKAADAEACRSALLRGREAMHTLGHALGIPLETPDLARLAEGAIACGTAGKPSGAGGGDCGIAFAFDSDQATCVKEGWEGVAIRPLRLSIAFRGLSTPSVG
ncbi:mevalonate kinase [compost metagenome]